jgi:uracil-DNA glycosylase family 4
MFSCPEADCLRCPRLVAFRSANQKKYPAYYNGAVPSFGSLDAEILVVGLAPGLKGANQTGRPFTGDFAGDVLYRSLTKMGLSEGTYGAHAEDGFTLRNVRITNAVRCVPPANKPFPEEVAQCGAFLMQEIAAMPKLHTILCLGKTSHDAVLSILKLKKSLYPFAHGSDYSFSHSKKTMRLLSSYHTSRYNIQTKRLTQEMFNQVVQSIAA